MSNTSLNQITPIVFLPYWFESIFSRGQLKTRDVFDVQKLYQYVSTEDLCQLTILNDNATTYFDLSSDWRSFLTDPDSTLAHHIQPQASLFLSTLEDRLFNQQQTSTDNCAFKTQAVHQSEVPDLKILVFVYPQAKHTHSKKKELFELYKSITQLQFDTTLTLKPSPAYYKYVEML